MSIVEMIKDKAKKLNKKIVLVEGEDSRVVEAASVCVKEGIANIVLLGNPEEIAKANPTIEYAIISNIILATIINTEGLIPNLLKTIDIPLTPKQTILYWRKNKLNATAVIKQPKSNINILLKTFFLYTASISCSTLFSFILLNNITTS